MEPATGAIAELPDYALWAVNVTGGSRNWMRAEKLEFDCVVTFYRPDKSRYLTEHHFEVHPWSNSIIISSQEPLSRFVWLFVGGQFKTLEGSSNVDVAGKMITYRDYAEAVLTLTTAPVRFADDGAEFNRESKPAKVEGVWYYPINGVYKPEPGRPAGKAAKPYWSRVVFYQQRKKSVISMVQFVRADENKCLAVRGYDYADVSKQGVALPSRIELFSADASCVLKERLVTLDVK